MLKSKTIAEAIASHEIKNGKGDVIQLVLDFLARHRMLDMLPNIAFHLKLISDKEKKSQECHMNIAHEVLKHEALETAKKITSADLHLDDIHMAHDPELIGGFTLKHNGVLYDASLKNKLDRLQAKLIA